VRRSRLAAFETFYPDALRATQIRAAPVEGAARRRQSDAPGGRARISAETL
jgi:hypothetical protein